MIEFILDKNKFYDVSLCIHEQEPWHSLCPQVPRVEFGFSTLHKNCVDRFLKDFDPINSPSFDELKIVFQPDSEIDYISFKKCTCIKTEVQPPQVFTNDDNPVSLECKTSVVFSEKKVVRR